MILHDVAFIPSPSQGVWHIGIFPIRAYAVCILIGILVAVAWSNKRWLQRGGKPGQVEAVAAWAVPFGIVGGRIYHVCTDWRTYFGGEGLNPIDALKIWDGGLGIWGAVLLGALGAYIGCKQQHIDLADFADAVAPPILLAQAIGRLGNYFNQELFGRETSMPWGLEIYERSYNGLENYQLVNGVSTGHIYKIVQPTFLYEIIWNLLVVVFLIYAEKKFSLRDGQVFATYVAGYCFGRFFIELLRDDPATHIAGLRINTITSSLLYFLALAWLLRSRHLHNSAGLKTAPLSAAEDNAGVITDEIPQVAESNPDQLSQNVDAVQSVDTAQQGEISTNNQQRKNDKEKSPGKKISQKISKKSISPDSSLRRARTNDRIYASSSVDMLDATQPYSLVYDTHDNHESHSMTIIASDAPSEELSHDHQNSLTHNDVLACTTNYNMTENYNDDNVSKHDNFIDVPETGFSTDSYELLPVKKNLSSSIAQPSDDYSDSYHEQQELLIENAPYVEDSSLTVYEEDDNYISEDFAQFHDPQPRENTDSSYDSDSDNNFIADDFLALLDIPDEPDTMSEPAPSLSARAGEDEKEKIGKKTYYYRKNTHHDTGEKKKVLPPPLPPVSEKSSIPEKLIDKTATNEGLKEKKSIPPPIFPPLPMQPPHPPRKNIKKRAPLKDNRHNMDE